MWCFAKSIYVWLIECERVNISIRSSQWRCSANYLFCSCQEAKIRHVARRLNMFEEHLLGIFFQNLFFRIFFVEHLTILPGCRISLQNNPEQILPGNIEIRKIGLKFHKFSWRTHLYLLNRLTFVNYMKSSSCRIPQILPGANHRENTCLVCAACWLFS